MTHFAIQQLEGLLGLPWGDTRIDLVFASLGVKRKPKLAEDKLLAWIPVNKAGIEFGFEDEAYFNAEPVSRRGHGKLLLTNLIFYAEREDMEQYGGPLPCGLEFGDPREVTRTKLGRYDDTRRSYIRDVYDLPTYRLILSYAIPTNGLEAVVMKRLRAPWPKLDTPMPPMPTIEAIKAALGENIAGRRFLDAFGAFDVRTSVDGLLMERSIDFKEEFGFALYFRESKLLWLADKQPGLVLGAVRFYRERDLDARQWRGELPYALDFEDSPGVVYEKVPAPPAAVSEEFLIGSGLWKFPDWGLHVLYSTYENVVFRVTVMAPGYWESFQSQADASDSSYDHG